MTGRLDQDHDTDKEGQPAPALNIRFAEAWDYRVKPAEEPAVPSA